MAPASVGLIDRVVRESRETDEVLVCMAQRLQSQLERQLTLVERLQVHGGDETLADLAELRELHLWAVGMAAGREDFGA